MGKGVVRLRDKCTGHGCYSPRVVDTASGNVITNKRGTVRRSDHWVTHCCGPSCHSSRSACGSRTVKVNGRSIFRRGDKIACGSRGNQCSSNVLAGGSCG